MTLDGYSDGGSRTQGIHDEKKALELGPIEQQAPRAFSTSSTCSPKLFQYQFFSRDDTIVTARKQYLKILFGGVFATVIVIFTVFALLWGAFFRTPTVNLAGWIIVRLFYSLSLFCTCSILMSRISTVGWLEMPSSRA
jgi:hypothetical protein